MKLSAYSAALVALVSLPALQMQPAQGAPRDIIRLCEEDEDDDDFGVESPRPPPPAPGPSPF